MRPGEPFQARLDLAHFALTEPVNVPGWDDAAPAVLPDERRGRWRFSDGARRQAARLSLLTPARPGRTCEMPPMLSVEGRESISADCPAYALA